MPFRLRVLLASLLVAALTVLLSSSESYLSTRAALDHAVDTSLQQAASQHDDGRGAFFEIVLPSGRSVSYGGQGTVTDPVILGVARGRTTTDVLRTVFVNRVPFRQLIVPEPAGTLVQCTGDDGEPSVCPVPTTFAEVFQVNFLGTADQLQGLARNLALEATGVLALAFLLGILITRSALRPLEDLTDEIEDIAESTDLSRRVDEGGHDELGRLRRVFNRLLASVDDSQSLQRQLVMDASHELRTPLTSLRTNAQVLQQAARLEPDDLSQITSDVLTQVDELTALIADLAELARGERSEGELAEVPLDELVVESVELARTYARLKDVTIETEVTPCLVSARNDRLVRAVSNLLTNAVKFSPRGGRVRVVVSNGRVIVSDAGPGVAEADRPYVFDRFWRSAAARALPGSGLGLSIVAQVVAESGGQVTVDADPELGGARFAITLPTIS